MIRLHTLCLVLYCVLSVGHEAGGGLDLFRGLVPTRSGVLIVLHVSHDVTAGTSLTAAEITRQSRSSSYVYSLNSQDNAVLEICKCSECQHHVLQDALGLATQSACLAAPAVGQKLVSRHGQAGKFCVLSSRDKLSSRPVLWRAACLGT